MKKVNSVHTYLLDVGEVSHKESGIRHIGGKQPERKVTQKMARYYMTKWSKKDLHTLT